MKIKNASDTLLNDNNSTVPNLKSAMKNWFQKILIKKVTKEIINFKTVETFTNIEFQGIMQPMNPQEISVKSTGQRDWAWHTIHSQTNIELKIDEIVVYKKTTYRVKSKLDYSLYGYFKYDLIEDFTR